MSNKYLTLSEFNLEGQFLGFVGDSSGACKYLRVAIASGEVRLKIPKELRCSLNQHLEIGEIISVFGLSKLNSHTGKIKFKVYGVKPLGICPSQKMPLPPKAKILVCQKSGCRKRGGQGLLSELEKTLCERGLQDQVVIETTGCLKRCNNAPNCILQLGHKEYKKVHPEAIASLLESHLYKLQQ
ncbi:(2Fe-2S) ferredoxin domain-containing protein [Chlorogloeopsis fritschii PCC 9212]|uniref:(2Fe-2S) ferredoxin domain-containing protein n=1 Tax=Chlorogloeopsis fritschii TaxID=1124 RepID=UPI0002F49A3B|nr:(2Fe-2S) ferredoxin domain-containing protein [Chlorogloeopsis fritschii]